MTISHKYEIKTTPTKVNGYKKNWMGHRECLASQLRIATTIRFCRKSVNYFTFPKVVANLTVYILRILLLQNIFYRTLD